MSPYSEFDLDPYVSLPAEKLIVGSTLPFDVFLKDHGIIIPLFNRGSVYDGVAMNILREKGVGMVHVKTSEGTELEAYLSRLPAAAKAGLDPVVYRQYIESRDRHYLIDRSLLLQGTRVAFNILLLREFRLSVLLPANEGTPAVIDDRVLHASGDIVIRPEDISRYNAYLQDLANSERLGGEERDRIRRSVIRENSKLILKDLLDNPRSGEKIKESVSVVNRMVECILENKSAAGDLLSLRNHDYYTYTHSVNVAVLSVGLALAAGLPREQIMRLGIGAMLHDVGKCAIPSAIINKPGRLDDEEYNIIKTHVPEGEQILRISPDVPEESFLAVSQHHERLSGKGYPGRRKEQEVHLFGRITSIVDCYDAMTTKRSYQPARTPFYALSVITREAADFDRDLLKAFIRMLGELKA
ncbi:MAG TPA: HD-GYP domain-containing protein [Nitrospirota bacterium]|nr:HD-GYP domain-containing protein [Nitrospirota bacterium]